MASVWIRSALCAPFILVVGCSTADSISLERPDSGTLPETPDAGVEERDPAAEIAAARCAYLQRCSPSYLGFQNLTLEQCLDTQKAEELATFNALEGAIGAGVVTYQEEMVSRCVAELAAVDCHIGLRPDAACNRIFVGTLTVGSRCYYSHECDQSWCSRLDTTSCGTCVAYAAVGEDCSQNYCTPGSLCWNVSAQTSERRCFARDVPEGGACETGEAGFCQGFLACVGSPRTGYSCMPPSGAGQSCSATALLHPPCDRDQGLLCIGGACTPLTYADRGEPCDRTQQCRLDSFCDPATNTCAILPAAGERCDTFNRCRADAWCSGAFCRPLVLEGGDCDSHAQCLGELRCLGRVDGLRTCRPLSWQLCE